MIGQLSALTHSGTIPLLRGTRFPPPANYIFMGLLGDGVTVNFGGGGQGPVLNLTEALGFELQTVALEA